MDKEESESALLTFTVWRFTTAIRSMSRLLRQRARTSPSINNPINSLFIVDRLYVVSKQVIHRRHGKLLALIFRFR